MRSHARSSLLALLTGVLLLLAVPIGAQAAPGIASFFAANCKTSTCKKQATPAEELEKAEKEGFTQAGGHPNFGITDFTVNAAGTFPNAVPEEIVNHVRTDVAPGLATSPQAVPKCSFEEFGKEIAPGLFTAPTCKASTELGENKVVVALFDPKTHAFITDVPLEGKVYNLEPPKGLGSDYGVAIELPEAITGFKGLYAHTLIEGSVEWGAEAEGTGKADYHDYFEINVSPELPLISSRLVFKGNIGTGGFLTNATICNGVGPNTTTRLRLKFEGGGTATESYSSPLGLSGCGLVPFEPGMKLGQSTTASDTPDGLTTELSLAHDPNPEHIDNSQVKTAKVVLPPGITINPSAAAGLEACTPTQIGIGTKNPIGCPAGSKLGTVALNVPGLPDGSLTGNFYLGEDEVPITKPPYTVYVSAESERFGIVVRLRGQVFPNPVTGQLTTTFTENPEQPFTSLTIKLKEGPLAPLANNLACEKTNGVTEFTPFTGSAAKEPTAPFEVTGCPATAAFTLSQGTAGEVPTAGSHTSYTFALARSDGQQFLQGVTTKLPSGLIGEIPDVTLCQEPQAAAGTCSSASRIGTARITAGAGPFPFAFSGPVYMTGPYNGAPFGLSIPVPAVAGPFNLGTVVTRAAIRIDQTTAQVGVQGTVPTIVGGVPIRLQDHERGSQQAGLPAQPDQLPARGHGNYPGLYVRSDAGPIEPVPGRRLRIARVQAVVQGDDGCEHVETQRREPRNDARPARRRGEREIGARDAAQAAALATDHAPESVPGSDVRGQPVQLSGSVDGRRGAGQHAHAAHENDRAGDPRLARRRRLPGPRPGPPGRRRDGHPQRWHGHQKQHHDEQLRRDARRARVEHHGEPADRPALRAGRLRRRVRVTAVHADDDHRPERGGVQTEHQDLDQELPGESRRQKGHRQHRLPDREDVRRRQDQGQRRESDRAAPRVQQRTERRLAEAPAEQQRPQPSQAILGEGQSRLPIEIEGPEQLLDDDGRQVPPSQARAGAARSRPAAPARGGRLAADDGARGRRGAPAGAWRQPCVTFQRSPLSLRFPAWTS